MKPRPAIFISHANPEDNDFAIWLGSHLSGAGYEVWADVLKLRGGEDWARKLEKALRERAFKMLLVGTPWGVEKDGVRNEIQIATEVAKKIEDGEFVIPLRLQQFDSPFQIVRAQYIDFMNGWGRGLSELFKTLESYSVPRTPSANSDSLENWRGAFLVKAKAVRDQPEELISNWLAITELPNAIAYFEFLGAGAEERAAALKASSRWPVALHGHGFFSCAKETDFQSEHGCALPISREKEWWFPHFLENGDEMRSIGRREAQNIVTQLIKSALENKLRESKLSRYGFSTGVSGWWVHSGLIPEDKVAFKWNDGPSGRRQLVGDASVGVSKYKWHFGISAKIWIGETPHVKLIPRIILSEDGSTALDDAKRMNRLRRSVTKSWRNPRWRDMLLALLFWLAKGERCIWLETGSESGLSLEVPPMSMTSGVSIFEGEGETTGTEEVEVESDDPAFVEEYEDYEEESPSEGEGDTVIEDKIDPGATGSLSP
ncbi:MAG: toll/interleukin-1 receptor domain-containing protein (plasmid) [Nitrospira sp.]